jgi:hypothetical protein
VLACPDESQPKRDDAAGKNVCAEVESVCFERLAIIFIGYDMKLA